MGIGQGLIPGRVSWVWNPAATNSTCANLPVSAELAEDNGDNIPLKGLGVHEHWNNPVDMEYSRNLGKGEGIELVKIFHSESGSV